MAEKRPFRAYSGENPYIFISYSHGDSTKVYAVINELFQMGYNVWYDQGIPNNALLDNEIASKIRRCEVFVAFISPNSAASEYVAQKELPLAMKHDKRQLFVRLREDDSGDYHSLTGGAPLVGVKDIAAHLPDSCRDCMHRDPQPIEVDLSVGIEFITDELNGFNYALSDGGLIITEFVGSSKRDEDGEPEFDSEIIVPARHNGFPVTGIAMSAFEDITLQSAEYEDDLNSVTLPDTITVLGDAAFSDAYYLDSINLPAFLTDIGIDCFSGCVCLGSIVLPHGLKTIGHSAFYECSELEEIIIPETVTSIGSQAFAECIALTKIVIPPGVTEFGQYIFEPMCDEYDPEEAEDWDGMSIHCLRGSPAHIWAIDQELPYTIISESEMESCMRPLREEYEAKKRAVDEADAEYARAAAAAASAQGVHASVICGAEDERRVHEVLDVLTPQGYRLTFNSGTETCSTVILCLSKANVDDSVLIRRALDCGKPVFPLMLDKNARLPEQFSGRFVIHTADMETGDLQNSIREHLNNYGCKGNPHAAADIQTQFGNTDYSYEMDITSGKRTSVTIKKYLGKGGDVVVPERLYDTPVVVIGMKAFAGREDITSITLPPTVVKLESHTFIDCSRLRRISLGGVGEISSYALAGCSSLETIEFPPSLKTVAKCSLSGCTALRELIIPETVRSIQQKAFSGCTSLERIELPGGDVSLDGRLFEGCTALREIIIPGADVKAAPELFQGCPASVAARVKYGSEAWKLSIERKQITIEI